MMLFSVKNYISTAHLMRFYGRHCRKVHSRFKGWHWPSYLIIANGHELWKYIRNNQTYIQTMKWHDCLKCDICSSSIPMWRSPWWRTPQTIRARGSQTSQKLRSCSDGNPRSSCGMAFRWWRMISDRGSVNPETIEPFRLKRWKSIGKVWKTTQSADYLAGFTALNLVMHL